ncbi:hypothetical protein Tco_0877158 [Tanacetum coccineum]|uniref:Uncharacterized protein n=1 Tax=Tanacetum coccineum TaxID=301880 RepID=A0ABQ5BX99_9ASTR
MEGVGLRRSSSQVQILPPSLPSHHLPISSDLGDYLTSPDLTQVAICPIHHEPSIFVSANVMDRSIGIDNPCLSWTDISQANTVSFESDYGCPGLTEIMIAFAPMEVGTVFEPAEALFDVENLKKTLILRDCAEALYENFLDYFRITGVWICRMCLASETFESSIRHDRTHRYEVLAGKSKLWTSTLWKSTSLVAAVRRPGTSIHTNTGGTSFFPQHP